MKTTQTLLCSLALLIAAGCGGGGDLDYGPLGTLSGKVTSGGNPIAEGTIVLEKEGGGGSGGAEIQSDGTFTVTDKIGGIPAGTYKVAFFPPTVEVDEGPNSPPSTGFKDMPNLPEKYRTFDTSGLTVEIKEGKNTHDFDLVP